MRKDTSQKNKILTNPEVKNKYSNTPFCPTVQNIKDILEIIIANTPSNNKGDNFVSLFTVVLNTSENLPDLAAFIITPTKIK